MINVITHLDHEHFWERDVCQLCGLDREGNLTVNAEWEATSIPRIRDHTEMTRLIARLTAQLDVAREALKVAEKAELYDLLTGIIDADVLVALFPVIDDAMVERAVKAIQAHYESDFAPNWEAMARAALAAALEETK